MIWECNNVVIFQKSVNINAASVTFDVDVKKDLGLSDSDNYVYIDIAVEFTETLTKKVSKVDSNVLVLRYSYEAILTRAQSFSPYTIYNFSISLRRFDGTPVRKCFQKIRKDYKKIFLKAASGIKVTVVITRYKTCNLNNVTNEWICPSDVIKNDYKTDSTGTISVLVPTSDYEHFIIEVWHN
jgi:hypothetical protein